MFPISSRLSQASRHSRKKAADVINEVVDIIKAVVKRHGRLQLPVYGGVFLRKIKNREKLQDADHMMRFASAKYITDFEKMNAFKDSHEAHYNALLDEYYEGVDRQNLLYEMIDAWDRFKPYSDIKKEIDIKLMIVHLENRWYTTKVFLIYSSTRI